MRSSGRTTVAARSVQLPTGSARMTCQNREWKFAGIADLLNVADIGEDIRVHGLCGITLAQDADDRRRVALPRFNREETVARAHRRRRDRSAGEYSPTPGGILEDLPFL